MILISLIALLISCQTKPAKIEPVEIEIEFPVFPDPAGRVFLAPSGMVYMELDYWLKIAEYKIEVDRTEELYKAGR